MVLWTQTYCGATVGIRDALDRTDDLAALADALPGVSQTLTDVNTLVSELPSQLDSFDGMAELRAALDDAGGGAGASCERLQTPPPA